MPVTDTALAFYAADGKPMQLSCLGATSTVWLENGNVTLNGQGLSALRGCPGEEYERYDRLS